MGLVSKLTRTVEWGDCDPAEIVFYPNYFKWFDQGTHHLFDLAGIPQTRIGEEFGVLGTPLVEAKATFKAPSLYFDEIVIESEITGWQRKTFSVTHRITNKGVLAVEGHEVRVWAARDPDNAGKLRAAEIPDAFKAYFEGGGSAI